MISIHISGAKNAVPLIRTSGIRGDVDDFGVFQYGNKAKMNVFRELSLVFIVFIKLFWYCYLLLAASDFL